jgi:hypothetical protein
VPYTLIAGDDPIDLTSCPPNLWPSRAPAKWALLVPRVQELLESIIPLMGEDHITWRAATRTPTASGLNPTGTLRKTWGRCRSMCVGRSPMMT